MLRTLAVRTRLRSLIRRNLGRTSIVLCYHRVAEVKHDPDRLAVTPRHFAEHMEVVARWQRCPVSSLVESKPRVRAGVLVTMDDAYRDTLLNAAPILRRHDVPALIFAPSSLCQRGELFWWELLRRLFASESKVPFEALEQLCQALTKEVALAHPEVAEMGGGVLNTPSALYVRFSELMRKANVCARRNFYECGMTLIGASGTRDEGYPMSPEELRQISKDGLIEIGGHTRTHPQLASLSRADQLREIAEDKKELEGILERPVRCFAYPYGSPVTDFNNESVSAAHEAGYRTAFAFTPSLIGEDSPPLELGRFWVENYDGDELARHLVLWFGRPRILDGELDGHHQGV
jgi:peptidoglycan/xylan/chitin deacetylase (PgdA/CDA1 family)